MHTHEAPLLRRWADEQRQVPVDESLASPLLDLHRSSDVNDIDPDHLALARRVLASRAAVAPGHVPTSARPGGPTFATTAGLQRQLVHSFLAARRQYFPPGQSDPLPGAATLAAERRDTFIVVKFMDEAPHLEATLDSLLNQSIDLSRVVVLAVDNNSTDGSGEIARRVAAQHGTRARVHYLNQDTPGAGNAARLGVDTCLATIMAMCEADGDWDRLQTATVAVSDGDTVYHPDLVRGVRQDLDAEPDVDAVMPFLFYKLTAALRLLHGHTPTDLRSLRALGGEGVEVPVRLTGPAAHLAFPRAARDVTTDGVRLTTTAGTTVSAPFTGRDDEGRRVAVLRDAEGRRAWVLEDRRLVLEVAPVSGYDAALVSLENGEVSTDEIWKWHTVVGHDLFLWWSFVGLGLEERFVFPDTSDALKTVRAWAIAIGGQHQLRRPGLRIATGSDYQSGRVLQAAGCAVALGTAQAPAETEIDRLLKMLRNFVNEQAVFYGDTRSEMLDRATGLYLHMTRIQGELEREVRSYPDTVFRDVAFPERVLFPLRWMVQNAVRYYAQGTLEAERVRRRFLEVALPSAADDVLATCLTPERVAAIVAAALHEKQRIAEQVAEEIIERHHRELMDFYVRTLRSCLRAHGIDPDGYGWLLDPALETRNALEHRPPSVDPLAVWSAVDFEIDQGRGQVLSARGAS